MRVNTKRLTNGDDDGEEDCPCGGGASADGFTEVEIRLAVMGKVIGNSEMDVGVIEGVFVQLCMDEYKEDAEGEDDCYGKW